MNEKENLRDKFAIAILPVIINNTSQLEYKYKGADNILLADCKLSYKIADKMIQAREISQIHIDCLSGNYPKPSIKQFLKALFK